MFGGKRIVVVTPAGRKRYLELLIPQIIAWKGVVDEYRLWVNTNNATDIEYMQSVEKAHPDFIRLEYLPHNMPYMENASIHVFFRNCIEANTVYVRFDDDVIELDTLDAFKSFLEFRIQNPNYFLVFGNILNNAILTHLHQRFGNVPLNDGIVQYSCLDPIGWDSGVFAEKLHRHVLAQPSLEVFRMPKFRWIFFDPQRVSINCISWLGETFAQFQGNVHFEEEAWLSGYQPMIVNQYNVIFGDFVCVHYAFGRQRPHLDKTNVFDLYKLRLQCKSHLS